MDNVHYIVPRVVSDSPKKLDRHSRYIDQLVTMATAIEDAVGSSRIAAAIVMHNKVVSYGLCQYKTHPLQSKFSRNDLAIYLHAETCAIKNALRSLELPDLLKCTMYIARAKYTDENKTRFTQGLAKPCCGCARAIATFGIKRVVYSLDNEGWEST